jgi:hypothetical protein
MRIPLNFTKNTKRKFWDDLNTVAEDLGETIPFMISNWNGCKNITDATTFKNALVGGRVKIPLTSIETERELEKKTA